MSISNHSIISQYIANGASTSFTYLCKIFSGSDLEVYVDNTLKTYTTHYTVSGVGNDAGGNVVFLSAPSNLSKITIKRTVVSERTTDFAQNGLFSAGVVNSEFDKLWAKLQELETILNDYTMKLPITGAAGTDTTFPVADANKSIVWDDTGTALTNGPTSADIAAAASNAAAAHADRIAAAADRAAADASATAAAVSAAKAASAAISYAVAL